MKSKEFSLAMEVIQHAIETLEKIERLEHREKQNKSLKTVIHQLKDATRIIKPTNK